MFNKKKAQENFQMEQPKQKKKKSKPFKVAVFGFAALFSITIITGIMSEDDPKEEVATVEAEASENKSSAKETEKKETAEEKAVKEYKADLQYNSGSFSDTFKDFVAHNQKLADNMFLLKDKDWVLEMGSIIARFRLNLEDANKLEAPASMQDVHEKYMQAMDEYQVFADDYPKAMDNGDWDRVEELSKHIDAGNALVDEASELLLTKE